MIGFLVIPVRAVQSKINSLGGPQGPLLATVKRWKRAWFGHFTHHDNRSKTILQGTLEGGQCHGQQRKCWMDNIKEWKKIFDELSLMSPWQPDQSRDWTELKWAKEQREGTRCWPVCDAQQHVEAVGQDEAHTANLCGQEPGCGGEQHRKHQHLLVVSITALPLFSDKQHVTEHI